MERYYKLQAGGKDAHVWFVDYDEEELATRLREARSLSIEAELLAERIPERLQSEWRLNVLRGYATRTIKIPDGLQGRTKLRILMLDPGIVLEEILVK